MNKQLTKNERYFISTGKYRSEKERKEARFGKEIKDKKYNNSLTGW